MGPSTLSSWALLVARVLEDRGLDARSLFRRANMPFDRLGDPNARYPLGCMQALWTLATEASGDPCFGLAVGRLWHPTTFHALGYVALASGSLREALTFVERYCRVVTTGARVELCDRDGEVSVSLRSNVDTHGRETTGHVAAIQAGLAALAVLCGAVRGDRLVPRAVHLSQRPVRVEPLEDFFGCPVGFEAGEDALVYSADRMDAPLVTANPVLLRFSEEAVGRYARQFQDSVTTARVRAAIAKALPSGAVDEAGIARSLNMSPRTLQRKLRDERSTFRGLLDETRRGLVAEYSRDPTLSSAEIAWLVGFSDPTSLSRAMRRWNGRLTAGGL